MLNMDLEFAEVILVLYSLEFSVYHLSKVFPGRIKATKPAMTLTNPAVIVIVDTCEQQYIRCNGRSHILSCYLSWIILAPSCLFVPPLAAATC